MVTQSPAEEPNLAAPHQGPRLTLPRKTREPTRTGNTAEMEPYTPPDQLTHAPIPSQPRAGRATARVSLCSTLRVELTVSFDISRSTTGRFNVYRVPAGGMAHRALRQHPADRGYILPVLQPSITLAPHRRQELCVKVVVPPDDRVVVDGHPHADGLAHGEEAVAQHVLDRFLKRLSFGRGLGRDHTRADRGCRRRGGFR